MNGPRIARLAWRNLWRNKRRTVLTLVAITFGMFLAILMTAMQDRSFGDMIDTAARMRSGHVAIQHPGQQDAPSLAKTVPDAQGLADRLEQVDGVQRAVSRIQGPAMLATAGQSYGGIFIAIDPADEDTQTLAYLEGISEGRMLSDADSRDIVLGQAMARNLKVEPGGKVVVTMMDKQGEIASELYRVSGLLSTGSESTDRGIALLPRDRVARSLGYDAGEATEIALFSDDARAAPRIQAAVQPALPADTVALTWDQIQVELQGFVAMKIGGAVFMELVILVLVAASIFNTLLVSVMERTREFGIMLAIGWAPAQIFRLVMWESTWLAIVGVLGGGLITAFPYKYLYDNPINYADMMAADDPNMNLDIGGVGMSSELAIGIFPENLAIIIAAIVLATLLSGLYPAWKAGRTVPVESIKLV